MKNKVLYSILLVVVVLISVYTYRQFQKSPIPEATSVPENAAEKYEALFKRAQKGDVSARDEALEKSSKSSLREREEAATALGFFDDEKSTKALLKLLNDPNEKVKIRTIYALTQTKSANRESILVNEINSKKLTDREKVHLYTALLQTTSTEATTKLCIEHMLYLLQNSKDEVSRQLASSALAQISLEMENVSEQFKKLLYDSNPVVVSNVIRHFASNKNSWFIGIAPSFYKNTDLPELVKIALIETMHLTCVNNRSVYFKDYLNSQKASVRKAMLSQLVFHNSESTIELLNSFIAGSTVDTEKALAERTIAQIKTRTNRCQ